MSLARFEKTESAVITDSLCKSYGPLKAVENLSLNIPKGDFFGLLGPNGSGKTTTIHILATLIQSTSGQAKILGLDPKKDAVKIRKKIGLVFQETTVDRSLSLTQNLYFCGQLHGLNKSTIDERAQPLIKLFGLENHVKRPLASLSGGMRRAVDIIRGIIHEPDMLILDEPTIGLDLPNRLKIWRFIQDLRKRSGMTVLLTTHYLEEAQDCDTVAFIESGNLINQGNPIELIDKLGDHIVEIKGSNAGKKNIELLLGNSLDGHGISYFKCLNKDLESLTEVQKKNKKEIEMWRIRKPNLNDVFLWNTQKK